MHISILLPEISCFFVTVTVEWNKEQHKFFNILGYIAHNFKFTLQLYHTSSQIKPKTSENQI